MRAAIIKMFSICLIGLGTVFLILSYLDGPDEDFPLSNIIVLDRGKKVSFDFQPKYNSIYSVFLNLKPLSVNEALDLRCVLGEINPNSTPCKNHEPRIEFSWQLVQGANLIKKGNVFDEPEGWLAGDGLSRRLCSFDATKTVKYNITMNFENVVGDLSGLNAKLLVRPSESIIKEGLVNRSLLFLKGCLMIGFGGLIFLSFTIIKKISERI